MKSTHRNVRRANVNNRDTQMTIKLVEFLYALRREVLRNTRGR